MSKKITELDAITVLAAEDILPLVDFGVTTTKNMNVTNFFGGLPVPLKILETAAAIADGAGIEDHAVFVHLEEGNLLIENTYESTGFTALGHSLRSPGRAQLWLNACDIVGGDQAADIMFGNGPLIQDNIYWMISSRPDDQDAPGAHDLGKRLIIFEGPGNYSNDWMPRITIMPDGTDAKFAFHANDQFDYDPSATFDITSDIWRKIDFVHGAETARGRLGSDADALCLTSNTYYDGANWQFDDVAERSHVYTQQISRNRHEFRTSPVGTAPTDTYNRMVIEEAGVGIGVFPAGVVAERTLDVVGGSGVMFRLSSDRTDATLKNADIGGGHFTNAEEDVVLARISSTGGNTTLFIGGGVGNMNTATRVSVYAAANDVTLTGTEILRGTVTELRAEVPIKIKEAAAAVADTTGYGQLWVKNTDPCELWFTDDAGLDTQIV